MISITNDRISFDPKVMGGKACISGTHSPYSYLDAANIRAALAFAAKKVSSE